MSIPAIEALIERVIGKASSKFKLEMIENHKGEDWFELKSIQDLVLIRGSSKSALVSGFHWYLKHQCHLHRSWCGNRLSLSLPLPILDEPIRKQTPFSLRYNLNYCTYSYSMPFWDWNRWEQELDFMSMNGINLMLTVTGQEEVWRRTLLRLNYSEQEIAEYLCGPAFFAWQWMQNLTSWGGPLPKWWYSEQAELARKIRNRMKELGIEAVVQGFSGMVPQNFTTKFANAAPVDQGIWCEFDRPFLLLPDDPMYKPVASIYYEELHALYGTDVHYYSIDPFHEGGHAEGVDIAQYAEQVEQSLLEHDSQAIWVLQAWEGNPKPELLAAISTQRTLILDLWCESKPAWKETDAFQGHPWIWNMIQNYGGKNGLYGNLNTIATAPREAIQHSSAGDLRGVGMAMEGIGTNPIMYDLLADMVWGEETPELNEWLKGYIVRRYGEVPASAHNAWSLLKDSVYSSEGVQQGAAESILCARPALEIEHVSTWGPKYIHYDVENVREACRQLYMAFDACGTSEGYLYDLVDVTRQTLADLSREKHKQMVEAYQVRDVPNFECKSRLFLQLLADQDQLLRTRKEFMLGPWLEEARARGRTEEEKRNFEYNARTLITLWGPASSSIKLHDYSHREWSGLLSSFYAPRWSIYIDALRQSLLMNQPLVEPNWYTWEEHWTREYNCPFPTEPEGSVRDIVENIIQTYL
ncbi:alpha-N-acetylglucosaminidase [Paenibacillus shirakamiensis]|uniref:Alpha-N-acetylglucosaminidase n=1 Tax=Paenibacillus shirakamiensis TaxID=1265935 RepID=A0ABS4JGY0_9BACL|nr:alpha-N-acetylglucosaminidase [Paenibacillus shirakamiensis]MBP2000201.1 alpha-N-acetylglucosaminidase [Paenibacillus shirakamiensis]